MFNACDNIPSALSRFINRYSDKRN